MNISDKVELKIVEKRMIKKKIHDSYLWQKGEYKLQGFEREDPELLK